LGDLQDFQILLRDVMIRILLTGLLALGVFTYASAQDPSLRFGAIVAIPTDNLRDQTKSPGIGGFGEGRFTVTQDSYLSLGLEYRIFEAKGGSGDRTALIDAGVVSGTRLGKNFSGFVGITAERIEWGRIKTTKPSFRAGVEYSFGSSGVFSKLYLTSTKAWSNTLSSVNIAVGIGF
jgi:hypothetical protein